MMQLDQDGLNFLLTLEGFKSKPYKDPLSIDGKPYTIGIGSITYEDGSPVQLTDAPISIQKADTMVNSYVGKVISPILEVALKVPQTQKELTGLICLIYNIGINGFLKSTLLKKINLKASVEEIKAAWLMWAKQPELKPRRIKEFNYYNG